LYERELVPAIYAAWVPIVIDLAPPKAGQRVLDVACGTGVIARSAAERVGITGSVTGIDAHPGMLAVARSRISTDDLSTAPIAWQEANASSLPLRDGTIDVAYCQAGLQSFADRQIALREMHRVLAPGGRMGVMVWRSIEHSPGFRAVADALDEHVGAGAAAAIRSLFALGDLDQVSGLVTGVGFTAVEGQTRSGMARFGSIEHFLRIYLAGPRVMTFLAQASAAKRIALQRQVTSALSNYARSGQLVFPIEAHLVSART